MKDGETHDRLKAEEYLLSHTWIYNWNCKCKTSQKVHDFLLFCTYFFRFTRKSNLRIKQTVFGFTDSSPKSSTYNQRFKFGDYYFMWNIVKKMNTNNEY